MQNSVNLTGRLTADIELKQTASGIPAVNFTLAVQGTLKMQTENMTLIFLVA